MQGEVLQRLARFRGGLPVGDRKGAPSLLTYTAGADPAGSPHSVQILFSKLQGGHLLGEKLSVYFATGRVRDEGLEGPDTGAQGRFLRYPCQIEAGSWSSAGHGRVGQQGSRPPSSSLVFGGQSFRVL